MLLASIAVNALVVPTSILPDPKENDAVEEDGVIIETPKPFDYTDYKYVYMNYTCWIVILLLFYGLAALTYTAMSDAVPDILTAFQNFNAFIVGPSAPVPPARPLVQFAVCFVLVSLASSMLMVESKRYSKGFLDSVTRIAADEGDDDDGEDQPMQEDAAVQRQKYRKDLVAAMNWIHAICVLCFAVTLTRVAQA